MHARPKHPPSRGKTGILRALRSDENGFSAIEFAMIVPVMIAIYMGAVEFSHALTIDRRVTSVASAAADLVAQSEQVSARDVEDIFTASSSIMQPYSADPISIVLSSVVADKKNKTEIAWSCALNANPRSEGEKFTLPTGLTQPFTSIIMAEVTYIYMPPIGHYMTGGITMTETFYLRPRRSITVEKTGGRC